MFTKFTNSHALYFCITLLSIDDLAVLLFIGLHAVGFGRWGMRRGKSFFQQRKYLVCMVVIIVNVDNYEALVKRLWFRLDFFVYFCKRKVFETNASNEKGIRWKSWTMPVAVTSIFANPGRLVPLSMKDGKAAVEGRRLVRRPASDTKCRNWLSGIRAVCEHD